MVSSVSLKIDYINLDVILKETLLILFNIDILASSSDIFSAKIDSSFSEFYKLTELI